MSLNLFIIVVKIFVDTDDKSVDTFHTARYFNEQTEIWRLLPRPQYYIILISQGLTKRQLLLFKKLLLRILQVALLAYVAAFSIVPRVVIRLCSRIIRNQSINNKATIVHRNLSRLHSCYWISLKFVSTILAICCPAKGFTWREQSIRNKEELNDSPCVKTLQLFRPLSFLKPYCNTRICQTLGNLENYVTILTWWSDLSS